MREERRRTDCLKETIRFNFPLNKIQPSAFGCACEHTRAHTHTPRLQSGVLIEAGYCHVSMKLEKLISWKTVCFLPSNRHPLALPRSPSAWYEAAAKLISQGQLCARAACLFCRVGTRRARMYVILSRHPNENPCVLLVSLCICRLLTFDQLNTFWNFLNIFMLWNLICKTKIKKSHFYRFFFITALLKLVILAAENYCLT